MEQIAQASPQLMEITVRKRKHDAEFLVFVFVSVLKNEPFSDFSSIFFHEIKKMKTAYPAALAVVTFALFF